MKNMWEKHLEENGFGNKLAYFELARKVNNWQKLLIFFLLFQIFLYSCTF